MSLAPEATVLRPSRRRVARSRSLQIGVVLLVAMLVLGILGPSLLPDPNRQDLLASNLPPGSAGHPLGTDPLGRDILAWIASGIVVALVVSFGVTALSSIVGTFIGLVAGYVGGIADGVLMRFVDVALAVPPLVLFVAASVRVDPSATSLILLLSAVAWIPYARLVRAKVLSDRERGFVAAARLAGVSPLRILTLELLPNASTLLLVMASAQAGYVFLWEAALSFLGLGIRPPSTSLGFMISQGQTTLAQTWWIVVFPGLAIVLLVLALNLIGDGLRDRFQLDTGAA